MTDEQIDAIFGKYPWALDRGDEPRQIARAILAAREGVTTEIAYYHEDGTPETFLVAAKEPEALTDEQIDETATRYATMTRDGWLFRSESVLRDFVGECLAAVSPEAPEPDEITLQEIMETERRIEEIAEEYERGRRAGWEAALAAVSGTAPETDEKELAAEYERGRQAGITQVYDSIAGIGDAPPYLAQGAGEGPQPVAWLYKTAKPGQRSEWASIDPSDPTWWPMDQGYSSVTRTALVEAGEPENILPEKWIGKTYDGPIGFAKSALTPKEAPREPQPLQKALAELVALKDLKNEARRLRSDPYYTTQADWAELDYERRKDAAWDAARAALAQKEAREPLREALADMINLIESLVCQGAQTAVLYSAGQRRINTARAALATPKEGTEP